MPPKKIEDVGMHDMFCFEAELYVKISEILTPPTLGFVQNMSELQESANGKTVKVEHARPWLWSK